MSNGFTSYEKDRNDPFDEIITTPMLDGSQKELSPIFTEDIYLFSRLLRWSTFLHYNGSQYFDRPTTRPPPGLSAVFKGYDDSLSATDAFNNGTIDPSVLGGAPAPHADPTLSLYPLHVLLK